VCVCVCVEIFNVWVCVCICVGFCNVWMCVCPCVVFLVCVCGLLMCGCFRNICTCIYCFFVSLMYIYSYSLLV
jgi:hypothetical protein